LRSFSDLEGFKSQTVEVIGNGNGSFKPLRSFSDLKGFSFLEGLGFFGLKKCGYCKEEKELFFGRFFLWVFKG
jgi:hypothetical protein